jgi:uncharacterized protein YdgA (DUF945 family)
VTKKLILVVGIVAVVLAAAAAALPYWFGMQAESAYEAMLADMTKTGDVAITSNNFQRGWLESTADTTFGLAGTPVTVTVLHRISHGPLPLDDDFQPTPVLARVKSQISIGLPGSTLKLPPITGKTTVYLAGNSHTSLQMPVAKSTTSEGSGIEWKGFSGDFDTSADFKSTKGELNAPLLAITSNTGSFNLSRIKIGMDQQKSPSGFDVGTVNVGVDRIAVDGAPGKTTIDGLKVSSVVQETGGNLNSTVSFQFREALSGGSKQGPGQINIQIRKLDVATLVKFRKELGDLKKQKIPPEQANMMVLGKTLDLLGQLAKKSPELEITKLSFKTADGEVTGKAKFVLDGSQLDVSGNPMLMLKALSGEGEITLPESVVRLLATSDVKRDIDALKASGKLSEAEIAKLTPQRIAMITGQALKELPQYKDSVVSRLRLIPDGPNFKIAGALKNGQLMVNDQPLQLPASTVTK